MGPKGHERPVKYGVIAMDKLRHDLLEWDSLYVSGRLQKPVWFCCSADLQVRLLRGSPAIIDAMNHNLKSAILAVLPLLPFQFSSYDLFIVAMLLVVLFTGHHSSELQRRYSHLLCRKPSQSAEHRWRQLQQFLRALQALSCRLPVDSSSPRSWQLVWARRDHPKSGSHCCFVAFVASFRREITASIWITCCERGRPASGTAARFVRTKINDSVWWGEEEW